METKKKIKVIISGGGTGGHIFPALAIARAILAENDNADILFVGAKGKMEMETVPDAGFPIKGLWISGFQRKLSLKNLSFPLKLISSLFAARKIIKDFNPDVAIGVGGFASGPTLKMAARAGVPCVIQEQNSYPGITNKLLAKDVKKICVAYEGMDQFFPKEKILLTGNPIRKQVIEIENKKPEAISFFSLQENRKTILIVGGSLGAQSINNAIIHQILDWTKLDANIIWQTGKTGTDLAKDAIRKYSATNIYPHTFITKMDLAYAAADLIISRAGAIAISEISAIGKPVIFVPFPYAAEDHQTKNAEKFVKKKAALMIADDKVKADLYTLVSIYIKQEDGLNSMAEKIKKLGIRNADEIIAKEVLKLTK